MPDLELSGFTANHTVFLRAQPRKMRLESLTYQTMAEDKRNYQTNRSPMDYLPAPADFFSPMRLSLPAMSLEMFARCRQNSSTLMARMASATMRGPNMNT